MNDAAKTSSDSHTPGASQLPNWVSGGPCRALIFARRLAVASFIFLLLGRLLFPVDDPDVFWHIPIGRWILANGTVPATEQWNHFGIGHVFRAYSWMSEVVFALAEAHLGFSGVWWVQTVLAFLVIAAAGVAWTALGREGVWVDGAVTGGSIRFSLWARYLGTLAALAFLVEVMIVFAAPRPQVITFLVFALIPWLADNALRRGVTPVNRAVAFFFFFLWANNHIAMVLGLGYLGGLIFAFDRKRLILTLKILAWAGAGTLVTPYFGSVWITFFSKIGHVSRFANNIEEFATITPAHWLFPLWLTLAVLFVVVLAMGGKSLLRRERLFQTLVALAFLVLGIYCAKFLAFSALAVLTFAIWNQDVIWSCLGRAWSRFTGIVAHSERWNCGADRLKVLASRLRGGLLEVFVWCLVAVAMFLAGAPGYVAGARCPALQPAVYSESALNEVLGKNMPMPILTDFSNGGYLMYRLSDEKGNIAAPVAIDGRTNILSPEEADAYYAMESGKDGWEKFIQLYQPKTIVWPSARLGQGLMRHLRESGSGWTEVRKEEGEGGYCVFVREDAVPHLP